MDNLLKHDFFKDRSLEVTLEQRNVHIWVNLWSKVKNQEDPVNEIIQIFNESWKEMEYPNGQMLPLENKETPDGPGEEKMDDYINMLEDMLEKSGNIILTGAPGTGKTYLAQKIAAKMIGINGAEFQKELENNTHYGFVQFHPSYDYTDFVEGLRPTKPDDNGNIGFELKDGTFKAFCKKALNDPKKKFVFIIDEINRGEISKIFGELFFSIDPGYRGKKGKVKTQYTNLIDDGDVFYDGFYIPDNVYIIGTMNDIDRSVDSFDFAMRRRFTWKEVTAAESAEHMNLPQPIRNRMEGLNNAISNIPGLNPSYHIGGAYFLKLKKYGDDYGKLWKYHLKPLIHEYLRGIGDSEEQKEHIKNLKAAYDNDKPPSETNAGT
jgi:5-methylcytosine-specific restriction protein B